LPQMRAVLSMGLNCSSMGVKHRSKGSSANNFHKTGKYGRVKE
jgi:hypothetical protein